MAEILVDPDDLATISEIARRYETNRSTVSMWVHRAETNGFPEPKLATGGGTRLWSINEVTRWLAAS